MNYSEKRKLREASAMGESYVNGNISLVADFIGNSASKFIRVADYLETYGPHGSARDLANTIRRRS